MQPEVGDALEAGSSLTNLGNTQQEANELGANPSSPALDPIALSSGSMVAAGGHISQPPAASLTEGR